jgi:hypothetical protein
MRCEWQRSPEKEKGILVGCDCHQEWLLQWWWERYSAENDYPVAFIDLGMTKDAKEWCQKRGEVIPIHVDSSFIKTMEEIPIDFRKKWKKNLKSSSWATRSAWFKKPFACLNSPYQNTLWLDLDCEVLGSIEEIFSLYSSHFPLGLLLENKTLHPPHFNGGVIFFAHGLELIQKWAEDTIGLNACFWADDHILSALIDKLQFPVMELPEIFNWSPGKGVNANAIIYHWQGYHGKMWIRDYGGIKHILQSFLAEAFKDQCHGKK